MREQIRITLYINYTTIRQKKTMKMTNGLQTFITKEPKKNQKRTKKELSLRAAIVICYISYYKDGHEGCLWQKTSPNSKNMHYPHKSH